MHLIKYIGTILVSAHWFACLWGYVGNLDGKDGWYATDDLDAVDSPHIYKYVLALYFASMTLTTGARQSSCCLLSPPPRLMQSCIADR
jgi:hypothetical protein